MSDAELSEAGALADDWQNEPLDKQCFAGNQSEAAPGGSQAWREWGGVKLVSGLFVLAAVAAALTMPAASHGQVLRPRPQEKSAVSGTVEYPRTGCANADDILLLARHNTSRSECAAACQNKPGCIGFGYQKSCQPARLCKLWSGNCTHRENTCMAQHVLVSPMPIAATVEHPSTSCKNGVSIGLGNLHSVSLDLCTAACQDTPGCTGFGYKNKFCGEAGLCKLWRGNCTRVNNGCWAQHDMLARTPLRYTKAPKLFTCITEADTKVALKGTNGSKYIENVCSGAEWTGFNTKVEKYLERATQLVDQGLNDTLLVFMDGYDMAFGGCSHEEFINRYTKISVSSGGAPVISGVVLDIWPPTTKDVINYGTFNVRRDRVLDAFQLKGKAIFEHGRLAGSRFVNSGWLVGPPEHTRKVLACMLEMGRVPYDFKTTLPPQPENWPRYGSNHNYDDQYGLTACMSNYPELIALDYTGSLILNGLANYDQDLFRAGDRVYNKAVGGSAQCFIHAYGSTYKYWFPSLNLSA